MPARRRHEREPVQARQRPAPSRSCRSSAAVRPRRSNPRPSPTDTTVGARGTALSTGKSNSSPGMRTCRRTSPLAPNALRRSVELRRVALAGRAPNARREQHGRRVHDHERRDADCDEAGDDDAAEGPPVGRRRLHGQRFEIDLRSRIGVPTGSLRPERTRAVISTCVSGGSALAWLSSDGGTARYSSAFSDPGPPGEQVRLVAARARAGADRPSAATRISHLPLHRPCPRGSVGIRTQVGGGELRARAHCPRARGRAREPSPRCESSRIRDRARAA